MTDPGSMAPCPHPIWSIWAWRAWRLPGRWPDGGRRSTVARWTRRRAATAYAPIPDLIWQNHRSLRFRDHIGVSGCLTTATVVLSKTPDRRPESPITGRRQRALLISDRFFQNHWSLADVSPSHWPVADVSPSHWSVADVSPSHWSVADVSQSHWSGTYGWLNSRSIADDNQKWLIGR